jgi:hypothetical protein
MLSPERAFLIHLDSSSDLPAQRPAGRVEHVESGESTHFRSLADLFAFFGRYLDEDPRPRARPERCK